MYDTYVSIEKLNGAIPKDSFTLELDTSEYALYTDKGKLYGDDERLAVIIGNHLIQKYENDEEIRRVFGAVGPIQITGIVSQLLRTNKIKVKVSGTATI